MFLLQVTITDRLVAGLGRQDKGRSYTVVNGQVTPVGSTTGQTDTFTSAGTTLGTTGRNSGNQAVTIPPAGIIRQIPPPDLATLAVAANSNRLGGTGR